MKSAEIKDISIKDLQERIETEKAQLAKLKVQHAVSPVEKPQRYSSYADNPASKKRLIRNSYGKKS